MKHLPSLPALAAGVFLCSAAASPAQSPVSLTVLHSFTRLDSDYRNSDGFANLGHLEEGLDGSLYGVAPYGGANGQGTIFQITPAGDFQTLYSFKGPDAPASGTNAGGTNPHPALLRNPDGSFIGSTGNGGANGDGTVFRLTTDRQFNTLYDFSPAASGSGGAVADLARGADGNDYGISADRIATTGSSGTYIGNIYQVKPDGTVSIVYNFDAGPDHAPVYVLLGTDGNFYGLTGSFYYGDPGSLFRFTPAGVFTTLHTFGATDNADGTRDGIYSNPNLVQGADGAYYGTTQYGGANGTGTVFRITPAGEYSVFYSFFPHDTDNTTPPGGGSFPDEGLILGQDGNFYGTTAYGGAHDRGTIYQLTPKRVYSTVYSFDQVDGCYPTSLLTQAKDGTLYGSTSAGGAYNQGVIFKLTPSTHPAFFSGEALLDGGVYFLSFPNANSFGYYSYLDDPHYIYHYDLGFEYVFDAADGNGGVYFYDFTSKTFFYTSPSFPFPYLYDFTLDSVLYYYPDPTVADRYNIGGVRYFYDFAAGQAIVK